LNFLTLLLIIADLLVVTASTKQGIKKLYTNGGFTPVADKPEYVSHSQGIAARRNIEFVDKEE